MKVIATLLADFERSPLGTRSRLRDDLLGETVLGRTLRRVLAAKRVTSVHLLVHVSQHTLAREAAEGLNVVVDTHEATPPFWQGQVASARKWSLDAWRGGIAGYTAFDEYLHPWVLEALARREGAEAVAVVPPAAPLLDPVMLDAMIEQFERVRHEMRLVFTQCAPGLAATVCSPALIADLASSPQPLGRVMAYRPADPQRDMVMQSCYYSTEAVVAHGVGRCVVDTLSAADRVAAILRDLGSTNSKTTDTLAVSSWLRGHRHDIPAAPAEVEVELTTEDPLPGSTLRPRGSAVPARSRMSEATFARVIEGLVGRDDACLVLGGFGDPLMHPRWAEFVRTAREAGVFGIAVRTPAIHLDDAGITALIGNRVDVLNVTLDANTAETYARVHGLDAFDRVIANINRCMEACRKADCPPPWVVCEMVKTRETMPEMEAFYDRWASQTGGAVIAGPSDYAGQRPDLAVMQMAPPARSVCNRIFTRATVLADGRVLACEQDFRGLHAVGDLQTASLDALWKGPAINALRAAHLAGRFDAMPLCPHCNEWHRP
jgi:hypothetical protein